MERVRWRERDGERERERWEKGLEPERGQEEIMHPQPYGLLCYSISLPLETQEEKNRESEG